MSKAAQAFFKTFQNNSEREIEEYANVDAFMLKLLFAHWLLSFTLSAYLFDGFYLGFLGGGALFFVAFVTYMQFKGTLTYRYIIGIVLLSFSILFIQQSGGRIEMHFHIFGALSFLVAYRDLKPMTLASLYILIHHLIFNYFQQYNVEILQTPIVIFNYGCGLDIVALHGTMVLFEWYVLSRIILRKQDEYEQIIQMQDELNSINKNLESIVQIRTKELEETKNEAIKANKLKSEFLANISHEIRTPMNAVIGFTELLEKTKQTNLNKSYIKSIKDSSKALLHVINDILDLSKVEAGKLKIEYAAFSIRELATEIENMFVLKTKLLDFDYIVQVDEDVPRSIVLDEVRVRQILINLVSNAVKFTKKGYVKVTFSAFGNMTSKNIVLSIIVEDTGIGVEKSEQKNIFEAFIQKNMQSIKEFGGTGLGLSIVQKLAKLMNGKVSLESELDKGSTFRIDFYDVEVSDEENMPINYHKIIYKFEPATILLVDDIEINRRLILEHFKDEPFEIIEATDGEEALQILQSQKIDLVLMDIKMPVMNGYESCTKMKLNKDIVIIALTASIVDVEENDENKIFDELLMKPIDFDALYYAMSKYIPATLTSSGSMNEVKQNFKSIDYRALIEKNESLISLYDAAKEDGDMEKIKYFAEQLDLFADSIENKELKITAQKLAMLADNFDVAECEIILGMFA